MNITHEILDRSESLQDELHGFISTYSKLNPSLEYETVTTVFLLLKIAELEQKINVNNTGNQPG